MANALKGDRYKAAFERINSAINDGHPFEAVTLCESIISDRLLSNVKGRRVYTGGRLNDLVGRANLPDKLRADLGKWRKQRNIVIHEFVKTEPGESPNKSVEEALKDVERAAREGKKLAREVCKWHRDELNKAKRERR